MKNLLSVHGKKVFVIGASGLIGSLLVDALVKSGALVVAADILIDKIKFLAAQSNEEIGNQVVLPITIDITDKASIDRAIEDASACFGSLDAMVNAAYPKTTSYGKVFEEVTFESLCENINIHLGGFFLVAQRFGEYFKMCGSGNILLYSSIYGRTAPDFDIYKDTNMTMPVEYAAIKASINNLVRYIAVYYGPNGVRINSISPGGVYDNQNKLFVEKYCRKCPLRRMASVKDIVGPTLFLLSDASSYITGQDIVVDGGITCSL